MTQTKMWAQTIRLIVWMGLVVPALQPAGAGAQWKLLFQSDSAGRDLTGGVYFLKLPGPPRIGFVIGSDTANNFRVSNDGSVIYKTTDGGLTWSAVPIKTQNGIPLQVGAEAKEIVFKDSMTGWAGAFKTTDQGNTWVFVDNGFDPTGLYYDSASGGLFAATWSTTWTTMSLLVSWDEGSTWVPVPNSGPFGGYNGFAFNDDSRGIVAGGGGDNPSPWLRTSDQGKTWAPLKIDSECWQPIAIKGTNTQFAITDRWGNVLRTDNLWDSSWVVYSFPYSGYSPYSYYFKGFSNGSILGDLNHLFVQAASGIYMSTDQGKSWKYLCGQPYDTTDYTLFDHRFYVRYPYVCILTRPTITASQLWMLNVDSMQYFPTGIAFPDGTKRTGVSAGTPVTVNYSPQTSDAVGIDTGHLVFHYDTRSLVLSALKLPASWNILDSSTANGIIQLTFTADSSADIPSPLVSMEFNTYLSSSSAKVYVDSAYLSGHRLNCDCQALSILGPDSVEIDFDGCGDSTILAAMEHEPPFRIESIVPNPAQNQLMITGRGLAGASVELYTALGTTPQPPPPSLRSAGGGVMLDVSSLPSGIYFLRLSESGFVETRSVAIER